MIFVLTTIFLGSVSSEDKRTEWAYFAIVPKQKEEICHFIESKYSKDRFKLWHSQYGMMPVNINYSSRSESGTK